MLKAKLKLKILISFYQVAVYTSWYIAINSAVSSALPGQCICIVACEKDSKVADFRQIPVCYSCKLERIS